MNDNQLNEWLSQNKFDISEPLRINQTIANATTPLMHAARLGNLDALNALLARGADSHLMNADSNGALWFACFSNSETCATTLVQSGAPLDSQNVNGATALIYCASAGKTPLVRLLLNAGADTGLMTLDDFTALELAANRDCMKMLKEAKVTSHV
ncbi:MAG: ankyrin repeat domain-containing protein [Gallionellaceae bacterium]|jgi:ankyrin repeat protein